MLRAGILEPAKIKEVCAINKMYTIEILRKETFEDAPFDYKRWYDQWFGPVEERGIWEVSLNDVRVFPVSAGIARLLQEYDVGWEISPENGCEITSAGIESLTKKQRSE
jgi:hypothetical protein